MENMRERLVLSFHWSSSGARRGWGTGVSYHVKIEGGTGVCFNAEVFLVMCVAVVYRGFCGCHSL